MKKLLLALCLTPFALMAQKSGSSDVIINNGVPVVNGKMKTEIPAKYKKAKVETAAYKMASSYDPHAVQIGSTTYDLMTNASIARRIHLYPDGQISVVWTSSQQMDASFPDRGTAYVHYDGKDWSSMNLLRLENDRAGWPNITPYKEAGQKEKEMIVSHYASNLTSVSGGQFWLSNSEVGKSDFDSLFVNDKLVGPLWPRIGSSGNLIHYIAVYNATNSGQDTVWKNGIYNPVVYGRYNVDEKKFDIAEMALPGYDSTRYRSGSADQYSLDVRDSIVAVVIGGIFNDVSLFKSTDYGKTWKKTIVDSFVLAPYDAASDAVFDTTLTSDGSVNVTIDKKGVAHVFYALQTVWNDDETDGKYNYRPVNFMAHWDEANKKAQIIAEVSDIDEDGTLNIFNATYDNTQGGYNHPLVTYPSGSVDKNGNLYLLYSAPNETDLTIDGMINFRDLFIVYSKDGGLTWSAPQTVTGDEAEYEDVFGTLTRDADDYLHITWMRDDDPGIALVNLSSPVTNKIMYAKVPVIDVLNDKLGLFNAMSVGITNPRNNDLFKVSEAYPNPASDRVNLKLNMKRSASVSIQLTDMMGKVISTETYNNVGAGTQVLGLNVEGLSKGVYFCKITAGGNSATQKIVVK